MNRKFLDLAFKYAEKAYKCDEVPIGAVIVKDNEVIGYGYNQKEKKNSANKKRNDQEESQPVLEEKPVQII